MIHKTLTVGFSDLDGFIKLIELVGEEKAIKSLFIKFKEIEKINGDSVSTGKNISSISICEKGKIFYFFTGLATGTGDTIEMGNLSILQHS